MPENEMTSVERARRAALLCCHFARNFAYYSVFRSSSLLSTEGFWFTVHGNFVDVCVLEWCKLFGNRKGKYHWKNVMPNQDQFRRELLALQTSFSALQTDSALPLHFDRYYDQCLTAAKGVLQQVNGVRDA